MFLTVIIFLARVFTFTSHPSDLVNLEQFPGECSDWAVEGCTRIVLKELGSANGCLRPIDIPTTFNVIFKYKEGMSKQIEDCANGVKGSKQYFSSPVSETSDSFQYFSHYTVLTAIFGFIDDMYISATTQAPGQVLVSAQSQLRIGQSDIEKNYNNLYSFYECLNSELEGVLEPKACT